MVRETTSRINPTAGKKSNTTLCDDDELKDKSYDERMKVFVRADKSGRLAIVKEEMVAKQKKLGAIHDLLLSEIAPQYIKMMDKISEREDDGQWADLEDDSDDDDGEEDMT